jgi:hypothetical protein
MSVAYTLALTRNRASHLWMPRTLSNEGQLGENLGTFTTLGKPGDVHHVYLRSARTVGIQSA